MVYSITLNKKCVQFLQVLTYYIYIYIYIYIYVVRPPSTGERSDTATITGQG
jgi:hypothetical protein